MVVLQRETYEFRPATVKDAAGLVYTGSWHYQITAHGQRPAGTWLASVSHAGRVGFVIQNLTPGTYWLWIRLDDDSPYLPVPQPSTFVVS